MVGKAYIDTSSMSHRCQQSCGSLRASWSMGYGIGSRCGCSLTWGAVRTCAEECGVGGIVAVAEDRDPESKSDDDGEY